MARRERLSGNNRCPANYQCLPPSSISGNSLSQIQSKSHVASIFIVSPVINSVADHIGVDDAVRVVARGGRWGAAAWHATKQVGVTGAFGAGGFAAGYYGNGHDFDSGLFYGNLASMPGNLLARKLIPCFAAGTPIRTPQGQMPIEQLRVGDLVLSRDEHDPNSPVAAKVIEEVFVRQGEILNLHVGGRVIKTTPEHPFYVKDQGWTAAGELEIGDLLSTEAAGGWVAVEDVLDTGQVETVYNFRVADYHTYFVGSTHWGFSVWVHNSYELDDVLRLSNQGIQNPRRLGASSKSLLGSEIHHIASDKGVGAGNRWADVFQHIFDGAGMSLQHPLNRVRLPGHAGPHGILSQVVFDQLLNATSGFARGSAGYRRALRIELAFMRRDLRDSTSILGALVRARSTDAAEHLWSVQQSVAAAARLGI